MGIPKKNQSSIEHGFYVQSCAYKNRAVLRGGGAYSERTKNCKVEQHLQRSRIHT